MEACCLRGDIARSPALPGPSTYALEKLRRDFRERVGVRLEDLRLVQEPTLKLGEKVWRGFREWACGELGEACFAELICLPPLLVELICGFGIHLFDSQQSLYLFRRLIVYCQRERPATRPFLGKAWSLVSRWESLEPPNHRTPMPVVVLRAMVTTAVSWGWFRMAGILMITFFGLCRPGEVLAARRKDLLLPQDLEFATLSLYVSAAGSTRTYAKRSSCSR